MAERIRDKSILFRVTEDERKLIEEKMKLAGIQNMRAYLLKMAIDGYVICIDLSDIKEMVSLLSNATNNLNQIARRVNETNNIYEEDIKDLQCNYELLWNKVESILLKLSEI